MVIVFLHLVFMVGSIQFGSVIFLGTLVAPVWITLELLDEV